MVKGLHYAHGHTNIPAHHHRRGRAPRRRRHRHHPLLRTREPVAAATTTRIGLPRLRPGRGRAIALHPPRQGPRLHAGRNPRTAGAFHRPRAWREKRQAARGSAAGRGRTAHPRIATRQAGPETVDRRLSGPRRARTLSDPSRVGRGGGRMNMHDHHAHAHGHGGDDHRHTDDGHRVTDPVCGMRVDPQTSPHRAEHAGHTYHCCSAGCRGKFVADPARYLATSDDKPAAVTPEVPAGTIYTCPMHPEVRQIGPGHCPKCGMALEPLLPAAVADDDGDLRALTHRFWVLVALTIPVFVLAMGPHLFGWQLPSPWNAMAGWIEAVLASVVVLWGGAPFFVRGWRSLRPWSPNMYTLIALGTGVAWLYSAVAFLLPELFPAGMRDMHGRVGVYFESAAVIVTLVTMGDWLELRARRRTGSAIRALLDQI